MHPNPDPAARQAILAEFSLAEIVAELRERYTASGYGWLADLWAESHTKFYRTTDPELQRKHAQVRHHLTTELQRRAG